MSIATQEKSGHMICKYTFVKKVLQSPNVWCIFQRWAAILKNVSIKAIQIHNFWEKNWIKRYNFVGQNYFHRWSDGKNQTKIFFALMKRYNIPRSKSFTDEAMQLPSILENVSITGILKLYRLKRQNFSADSAEKLGLLRKKDWPHSNFSFFDVICTTEENSSVSMCVKKVQYY